MQSPALAVSTTTLVEDISAATKFTVKVPTSDETVCLEKPAPGGTLLIVGVGVAVTDGLGVGEVEGIGVKVGEGESTAGVSEGLGFSDGIGDGETRLTIFDKSIFPCVITYAPITTPVIIISGKRCISPRFLSIN